ncbi:MAG: hypothetical protein HGA67_01810 [Candidatus Yonathbacteria bacterium]|nr:hypothetical protein [Candidatus Yonathbacteria bacterium]
MKDINTFLTSHTFRGILIGVGAVLIVLVIFQVGVFVGYHKAGFSYRFGDNYSRMFGGPGEGRFGMGMMGGPDDGFFSNGNGAAGSIVSINLPTFVVAGPDKVEKVVGIGNDTRIRRFAEDLASSDLRVGDVVVVFGAPTDNAQIDAKLIRLLPEPPQDDVRN